MPHRTLGLNELAQYLHLPPPEIERLVHEQEIPFERHGPRVVFRKIDIDSWASPRVLRLPERRLTVYCRPKPGEQRPTADKQTPVSSLLNPDFIAPALQARTKSSVLREMAALAEKTGRVWDVPGLLAGLRAREELASTGLPGGLALLHTREPESYLFESAFLVLGRTIQEIPFGAPDGRPTQLFFLVACPDPGLHLSTLARICLMSQRSELLNDLQSAGDAQAMYDCIVRSERAALET